MQASVLFVCLGNICRSPMAEAVMRHLLKEASLDAQVTVDSAGTGDWHLGHPPHEGTRQELDAHGISYEGMRARLFRAEDAAEFSYIVCMDSKNEADVKELIGAASSPQTKVFKFMDLLPERGTPDVPDPYYTGNFDYVYELVKEGCERLVERIRSDLQ
ncbi:low molecular weight protein-tyrosine-phosphatase [Paenibacillus sp. GCM10023252]|uniref:low molecular weight protein-tyrosine-phosphatase n=1 Tax=Paenibacillus sp. GCM10023252 TaxID=3252649 RepID=UPI0036108A02